MSNIYSEVGKWITSFSPALTFCTPYTDADLLVARGDTRNLTIQTAPIGGVWSEQPSKVNLSARQVCVDIVSLNSTLFDLSVRTIGQHPSSYQVKSGDTLYRIALRFGITVSALRSANGLSSNTIYPGQILIIANGGNANQPTDSGSSSSLRTDSISSGTYVVQPGDNLFRIALRARVTMQAILVANNLTTTFLFVGQVLIIPPKSSVSPTPVMISTSLPSSNKPYIVQPGDNLFRIALRFGTTVAALQATNGLEGIDIYVGQILIIPQP